MSGQQSDRTPEALLHDIVDFARRASEGGEVYEVPPHLWRPLTRWVKRNWGDPAWKQLRQYEIAASLIAGLSNLFDTSERDSAAFVSALACLMMAYVAEHPALAEFGTKSKGLTIAKTPPGGDV